MLHRFFRDPRVLSRLRHGALGPALDELAAELHGRGHTPITIQQYCRAAHHFIRWVGTTGIPRSALNAEALSRFAQEHAAGQCVCPVGRGVSLPRVRASVGHLLMLLGVDPEPRALMASEARALMARDPADEVIAAAEEHWRGTCGLEAGTCREYARVARWFLKARYGDGPIDLGLLTPRDLLEHVSDYAGRVSPGTARQVTTALRSFLRALHFRGLCGAQLASAVPTVAYRKLSQLPCLMTDEQLRLLLGSFDRSTALGRRDYAVTLCLAGLGMRAGEVARLSLNDIDWRAGPMLIERSKNRRARQLPLPAQVGRALAAYLRRGRPRTTERRVFVRHRGPAGPITAKTVAAVVWEAHERGRVGASSRGTHALRHTAATRLLRAGASLKEIADVLGHRSLDSTVIYAKVDVERLAGATLPWPGRV